MKWYNPYYKKLLAIIIKKGDEDLSEIKDLLNLDKIRIFLEEELEDEILEGMILLYEEGAENENPQYMPLLHMAVTLNSQAVVKALLKNGANPNILDEDEWTPLQVAVINDFQEVVRILLKNGADINAKNDRGSTALHLAVSDQNLGMVQILLDNNADLSITNARGNAPLHIAINRPSTSDVKVHTKDIGKNILSVATVTTQQISDQSNKQIREITQVIPVNIKNLAKIQLSGITQGYSNNAKIIQALLSHDTSKESENAIINQSDRKWYYPIHLAVISENLDAAEVLLSDPRIDINASTGIVEDTALMLAVRENNYDMIKLLLSHKDIDLNTKNFLGRTAFECALKSKCSDEIIVMLWHDIERRIKNKTLKDHSIKLVHDLKIEEELDKLDAEYGIDIKSMVEFIYIPGLEVYGDEESDVSEESEASEHETLENQETEPEAEISDVGVGEGPLAKRQGRG